MTAVMKKLNPNLMVKDVKATVAFYRDILGFELVMAVPVSQDEVLSEIPKDKEIVYAVVKNAAVEIMFQAEQSLKNDIKELAGHTIGASCAFYFELENLEDFYESIKDKADVTKDLFTTWYGMKEFYIRDINGYILTFAEPAGEA